MLPYIQNQAAKRQPDLFISAPPGEGLPVRPGKPGFIGIVGEVGQLDFHRHGVSPERPHIVKVVRPLFVGQQTQSARDLRRELPFQIRKGQIGVLHHIMEQGHADAYFIGHLLRQMVGMEDVRLAALVRLPVVGGVGQPHGLVRQGCVDHALSSHSPLWASHHAGNAGSFGDRVGVQRL